MLVAHETSAWRRSVLATGVAFETPCETEIVKGVNSKYTMLHSCFGLVSYALIAFTGSTGADSNANEMTPRVRRTLDLDFLYVRLIQNLLIGPGEDLFRG